MKTCNICNSDIDVEAGDIKGYFGISPVAFCVWYVVNDRYGYTMPGI